MRTSDSSKVAGSTSCLEKAQHSQPIIPLLPPSPRKRENDSGRVALDLHAHCCILSPYLATLLLSQYTYTTSTTSQTPQSHITGSDSYYNNIHYL